MNISYMILPNAVLPFYPFFMEKLEISCIMKECDWKVNRECTYLRLIQIVHPLGKRVELALLLDGQYQIESMMMATSYRNTQEGKVYSGYSVLEGIEKMKLFLDF